MEIILPVEIMDKHTGAWDGYWRKVILAQAVWGRCGWLDTHDRGRAF
jgi:hypothetical protein